MKDNKYVIKHPEAFLDLMSEISGDKKYNAKCIGINDDCNLIAEKENGENVILTSGEISIRIK